MKSLRADLEANQREKSPSFLPPPDAPKPLGAEAFWPWVLPPEGLSVRGYLQSQYESHQDSQDQLTQDGTSLNQDRFSIRRARVSLTGEWQYAAVALELDANTTHGPQVDLHKAEASLQYRPDRSRPPIVMATARALRHALRLRAGRVARDALLHGAIPGLARVLPGRAGRRDALRGRARLLPLDDRGAERRAARGKLGASQLQDPNKAKDVVFRFGFDTSPLRDLQVAADVSSLRGMGFHPGTSATSATIQWKDLNEDGAVQPYEIVGIPGASATPSANFERWAVGLDARVSFKTPLGVTKVYGEFTLAQNLDRGLYIADPIVTNVDQRELGYYAGILQDVTKWGIVGLRFDVYDPNLDASDTRQGKLLPFSEAITTWSPMVGLVLPERARFLIQYDIIRNAFGAERGRRAHQPPGRRLHGSAPGAAMKRARPLLGALPLALVVVTAASASCGQGVEASSGVGEPILVGGAQFIPGDMPGSSPVDGGGLSPEGGPEAPLSVVEVGYQNTSVVPGASGKAFTALVTTDAVAVGVRLGDLGTGYWVVPVAGRDALVPGHDRRLVQRELRRRRLAGAAAAPARRPRLRRQRGRAARHDGVHREPGPGQRPRVRSERRWFPRSSSRCAGTPTSTSTFTSSRPTAPT